MIVLQLKERVFLPLEAEVISVDKFAEAGSVDRISKLSVFLLEGIRWSLESSLR